MIVTVAVKAGQSVRAGDPPQVEVEIDAPEPAEAPELYGDAQWMRVYVVQLPREVADEAHAVMEAGHGWRGIHADSVARAPRR